MWKTIHLIVMVILIVHQIQTHRTRHQNKMRQEPEEEAKEQTPDPATLKKSELFQSKLAEKLLEVQGRATPKSDERPVGTFEPPANQDPFVAYLGFINDSSLKSHEVIEKKMLTVKKQ